jgi:predicted nucleic acid-binding protein
MEALNEAIRLKFSAYDMLYFTITRKMGAMLLTLDHSLNQIAKKEGIRTFDFQGN